MVHRADRDSITAGDHGGEDEPATGSRPGPCARTSVICSSGSTTGAP